MRRSAPFLVSMLGVLGLALGLTYLVAIGLAFTPGYDQVTFFMIGESDLAFSYNFLLVGIPYVMLVAHLYLRTQLGLWMLDRGWVGEAAAYVEDKQETGLMRSAREASHHRLAQARVHAANADYDSAWKILDNDAFRRRLPGNLTSRWAHWSLEVALRREDLLSFRAVDETIDKKKLKGSAGAAIWACRAEEAARRRDESRWLECLESGAFIARHPRLAHARAIGSLRMPLGELEPDETLRSLLEASDEIHKAYPFLAAEIDALAVYLRYRETGEGPSDDALEELSEEGRHADSRARHVVRSVISVLRSSDEEN